MANACLIGRFDVCELYTREAIQTLGRTEARPLLEGALQLLREQNRYPVHRKAMQAALSNLP